MDRGDVAAQHVWGFASHMRLVSKKKSGSLKASHLNSKSLLRVTTVYATEYFCASVRGAYKAVTGSLLLPSILREQGTRCTQ